MRSAAVSIGNSILASQYNDLRKDAFAVAHLLPHEQATPDLTLFVESGVCFIGTTKVVFAGGNSPSFTAPITNPRIDLLTIDNAGVLARVAGTEAASPSIPAYPADKVVLCEVFNRVGQAQIRDTDPGGSNGYIQRDTRPFIGGAFISSADQIQNGIITATKLVDTYVKTTGDETVNGIKTFGSIPVLPASDPTTANQAVRKAYADAKAGHTMVALATPVNKVNTTTLAVFTDVDISADTGADTALFAIINVILTTTLAEAPTANRRGSIVEFRKNGSAVTANLPRLTSAIVVNNVPSTDSGQFIVPLDGSEIFEYQLAKVDTGGTPTVALLIDLVGYIK